MLQMFSESSSEKGPQSWSSGCLCLWAINGSNACHFSLRDFYEEIHLKHVFH